LLKRFCRPRANMPCFLTLNSIPTRSGIGMEADAETGGGRWTGTVAGGADARLERAGPVAESEVCVNAIVGLDANVCASDAWDKR
jgi:hypothetical protein